jgi:hypothetical protein
MMLRLLLAAALLVLCMAPTPGAVGGCGGDELDEPADVREYCAEREQLVCVRRYLRNEFSARDRDTCRYDAIERCMSRAFPDDCRPTQRVANACLNALASFDTIEIEEGSIEECSARALCSAIYDVEPGANPSDAGVGGRE